MSKRKKKLEAEEFLELLRNAFMNAIESKDEIRVSSNVYFNQNLRPFKYIEGEVILIEIGKCPKVEIKEVEE